VADARLSLTCQFQPPRSSPTVTSPSITHQSRPPHSSPTHTPVPTSTLESHTHQSRPPRELSGADASPGPRAAQLQRIRVTNCSALASPTAARWRARPHKGSKHPGLAWRTAGEGVLRERMPAEVRVRSERAPAEVRVPSERAPSERVPAEERAPAEGEVRRCQPRGCQQGRPSQGGGRHAHVCRPHHLLVHLSVVTAHASRPHLPAALHARASCSRALSRPRPCRRPCLRPVPRRARCAGRG